MGYLALSARPVSRQRLCDLFFDVPDDPRAALRWSLTKLRPLVEAPSRPRLIAERDMLRLDTQGMQVDALTVHARATQPDDALTLAHCDEALALMSGLLLEDCELPDRPEFSAWLAAQRQDFLSLAMRFARAAAKLSTGGDRLLRLHKLVSLDPLDEGATIALTRALLEAGRRAEAYGAIAAAERALAQAGLKPSPALRAALRGPIATSAASSDLMGPENVVRATSASSPSHQPSIGAIPFLNHSPDVLQPTWLDGFLETLVHQLARFRAFRVAGFSAALQFKDGRIADPQIMAAKLGVRDLVGGSVIVRDGVLKVRYRLVDSVDGSLYANGDIDVPMQDMVTTLLEDAPTELVLRVVHHIVAKGITRAYAEPAASRDAHDHFYLGLAAGLLAAPFDYANAIQSFEAALEIEPDLPMVLAYAAYARGHLGEGGGPDNIAIGRRQALSAIARAGDDAQALAIAGWALLHLGGDFNTALRSVESAIRLNPLGRVCWSASAWVRAMAGEYETPMRHWEMAERCNPLGAGIDQTFAGRALCSWMAGRNEDAMMWARRCLERAPNHAAGHLVAAAAAVELGRMEEARAAGEALLVAWPKGLSEPALSRTPIRDPEVKARLMNCVAQALPSVGDSAPAPAPAPVASAPVVAVLPFRDLSATPLPKHVAAGFFDGVTHALSRFRSIIVVSAASTSRYRDHLEDPKRVAEALGADILVGGSVVAAPGGELRLRWRAVEGETGRLITAGDVDGHLDDVWTLQEEAARRVAVEVEPLAQAEALRTLASRPTASADAYDLYLQGLYAGFSVQGRDYTAALAFFERALRIDPKFHPALALSPWAAAYANRISAPSDLARFAQMSRNALNLGRDDARTQATAGTALFYMAHDFEAARAAIERALALNPNEYTAWICGGWMHAMKGQAERAHAMFDRAERLNPLAYGANGLMSGRAMADFMVGRMQEAERFIKLALSGDDSHPSALMTGVATAHRLGLSAERAARSTRFLGIYPEGLKAIAIQSLPFENPACRALYFDAVAEGLAGVK